MQRFTIARDDSLDHAWPDLTLTSSGRLICVFSERTHHGNRDYSRFTLTHSDDRGRTWSPKRGLSQPLRYAEQTGPLDPTPSIRSVSLTSTCLCTSRELSPHRVLETSYPDRPKWEPQGDLAVHPLPRGG